MITHCVFCQKGTFHCPSWHLKTASLFYWAGEGEDHQEKVPWKHMVSLERKPNRSSCTPILPPPSPSTFTTHTHESDWKLDTVSSWQIPSNLAADSANTPTPKPHPTTPLALPPPTSQPHTPEPSNLLADLKEWGKQIEWGRKGIWELAGGNQRREEQHTWMTAQWWSNLDGRIQEVQPLQPHIPRVARP